MRMKKMNYIKVGLIIAFMIWVLFSIGKSDAYAETETTADVTEKSAGATHACSRDDGQCSADPRTDIWSDGGDDDDVVYWDQHGQLAAPFIWNGQVYDTDFKITNDIATFLTEEQMLAGFTMDSSIGLRDRNSVGGDPFRVQIKVTDGTTTYSDITDFTTSAGSSYETVTSQLIVPENTLSYSLATFGLILSGDSLTNGYAGPQTNDINLTATYALPSFDVVNEVVAYVTDVIDTTVTDILESSTMDTATMEIDVSTSTGTTSMTVGVSTGGVGTGTVIMSVPTASGGVQSMTINTGMSSSDSGGSVEAVAEVASAVAEVETAMSEATSEPKEDSKSESKSESKESKSESKQETKETKVDKAKVVQAIVSRILQSIEVSGGDINTTKLALMGLTDAAADFASYQTAMIPDVAFYDTTVSYESQQMPDPLGGIYNLGSDQMMNEMTDSQYNFGE